MSGENCWTVKTDQGTFGLDKQSKLFSSEGRIRRKATGVTRREPLRREYVRRRLK